MRCNMPFDGLHIGHYILLRAIGSGGMGEVYLAEDPRIHRQVAIKVVRTEAGAYPHDDSTKDAQRLFLREAKAIARLDHRSEEHTSELQSPCNLVCRLLLEKKKKKKRRL